jgi:hypothetical protein
MKWRRRGSWALATVGLALAAWLLLLAHPLAVLHLAGAASADLVLVALAWATLLVACRGLRLALVVGAPLRFPRAVGVTAVAQLAAAVLPLRLGDLALLPLLHATGVRGAARGLSFAVLLRFLDLNALAAWTLVAVLTAGVKPGLAVAMIAATLLAVAVVAFSERILGALVRRFRHRGGLRRRVLRQLLQVRRELRVAGRSPARVAGILVASLAIWGCVWGMSDALVHAMGLAWPPLVVLAAVVGAAVGGSLPINAIGNVGGLEAGWTAALAAVGVRGQEALRSAFAVHLWSLAILTLLGGAGAASLLLSHRGSSLRAFLAALSAARTSGEKP